MALTHEQNPMLAKAWVQFDGASAPTINESFNVTSLTDNGVGLYTVNLAITMASDNYIVTAIGEADSSNGQYAVAAFTTTAYQIRQIHAGVLADRNHVSSVVFGDLA